MLKGEGDFEHKWLCESFHLSIGKSHSEISNHRVGRKEYLILLIEIQLNLLMKPFHPSLNPIHPLPLPNGCGSCLIWFLCVVPEETEIITTKEYLNIFIDDDDGKDNDDKPH